MTMEQAMELIENYFSFDYLGDAMLEVRRDLDDAGAQAELADALVEAVCQENGEQEKDLLAQAARQRVEQFVKSAKSAAGTGCGK